MKRPKIHHHVDAELRAQERQLGGPDSAHAPELDPRDAEVLAKIAEGQIPQGVGHEFGLDGPQDLTDGD